MLSCHAILGTRPSRRMLPGLRADPPAVRPQTTPSRYRAVHLREWSDVAGLTLFRRHGAVASDVEVSSEWNLDELLDWAVDREVVSRADARLLADVYAVKPEARGSCRDVSEAYVSHAASSGVSQAALRQRAHRAKRRLTLAVRTTLAAGTPPPSPVRRTSTPKPAWMDLHRSMRPRGNTPFPLDETVHWVVST